MESQKYYIFLFDEKTQKWNKSSEPVDGYPVTLPNFPDVKAFVTKVYGVSKDNFVGWAVYDYKTGAKLTNKLHISLTLAVAYANGYLSNFSSETYQKAVESWVNTWGKANE